MQELVFRYEALSLAAAQLASQTAAAPTSIPAPFNFPAAQLDLSGPPLPPPAAQIPGSQLPAARANVQVLPAEPVALVTAPTPATALALDEASITAHETAEKVLKPTTSAGLYSEAEQPTSADAHAAAGDRADANSHGELPAAVAGELPAKTALETGAAGSDGGCRGESSIPQDDLSFARAMALQNDDRFLSLATGEAQADAQDVVPLSNPAAEVSPKGPLGPAEASQPSVAAIPEMTHAPSEAPPQHVSANITPLGTDESSMSSGYRADSEEPSINLNRIPSNGGQMLSDTENTGEATAHSRAPAAALTAGDFARRAGCNAALENHVSISSTAATVGDKDSLDIRRREVGLKGMGSGSDRVSELSTGPPSSAGGESRHDQEDKAALHEDGTGMALAEPQQEAAHSVQSPDNRAPATSSDADPFFETDLALKITPTPSEVCLSVHFDWSTADITLDQCNIANTTPPLFLLDVHGSRTVWYLQARLAAGNGLDSAASGTEATVHSKDSDAGKGTGVDDLFGGLTVAAPEANANHDKSLI